MHGLRVFAAMLALTLSASPVLLDGCVISCEMAAGRPAQHDTSGPACHRAMGASDSRHLAGRPMACGHDHLSSSDAVVTVAPEGDRLAASAIVAVPVAVAKRIVSQAAFQSLSPPVGGPPVVAASLPLRI